MFWCERGDLNPHGLNRWILNPKSIQILSDSYGNYCTCRVGTVAQIILPYARDRRGFAVVSVSDGQNANGIMICDVVPVAITFRPFVAVKLRYKTLRILVSELCHMSPHSLGLE